MKSWWAIKTPLLSSTAAKQIAGLKNLLTLHLSHLKTNSFIFSWTIWSWRESNYTAHCNWLNFLSTKTFDWSPARPSKTVANDVVHQRSCGGHLLNNDFCWAVVHAVVYFINWCNIEQEKCKELWALSICMNTPLWSAFFTQAIALTTHYHCENVS